MVIKVVTKTVTAPFYIFKWKKEKKNTFIQKKTYLDQWMSQRF